MLTFIRTFFFIIFGWYLIKWLARWIAAGSSDAGKREAGQREKDYERLTDQKIDDADYEDL